MYNQEDTRRKTNSTNNIKTVFGSNSHNSLMSGIDKKRSDISKDKYFFANSESKYLKCQNISNKVIRREVP